MTGQQLESTGEGFAIGARLEWVPSIFDPCQVPGDRERGVLDSSFAPEDVFSSPTGEAGRLVECCSRFVSEVFDGPLAEVAIAQIEAIWSDLFGVQPGTSKRSVQSVTHASVG